MEPVSDRQTSKPLILLKDSTHDHCIVPMIAREREENVAQDLLLSNLAFRWWVPEDNG